MSACHLNEQRGQDIYRIRVEKNHSGKRIGDSGGSKNEQSERDETVFDARSVNESFQQGGGGGIYSRIKPNVRRDCGYQDGRVRSGDECDHSWLP